MAKRCRSCGQTNEDERIFCSACGEPLDSELKLIMDLDKRSKSPRQTQERPHTPSKNEDDEILPTRRTKEKHTLLYIVIALAAIAMAGAVIALLFR